MATHFPPHLAVAAAGLIVAATVAAACGGSSAKSSAASTPAGGQTAPAGADRTPGRGFGNRTPPPAIATSIAEGTPCGSFRGPGSGAGGGVRTLTAVASLLGISEEQLQSELQAAGATIASVAEAHGQDRASLRQALIDATRQRLSDAVASGNTTQDQADQAESQFEANLDSLLDSNGARAFAPPTASR
jgi:hypothetical protein